MGTHYGIRPQGNVSYKNTFYVLVDTNGRNDGLTTVELNINESTGGDRYIDWGDGTVEVVNTELPSHTYASHGEYEIFAWGGTTTRLGQRGGSTNVGWTETIKTVRCGSEFGFTSMREAFYGLFSANSLDVSNLNTSNVTDMRYMFSECYLLTDLDVSNFDTSSVTDMSYMFSDCYWLTTLDVSNFDTSSVTNMSQMFKSCFSLTTLDVTNFDTSSVTDMSFMFNESGLTTLDVTNFDTSSVTNMNGMFQLCTSLTTLDVSNFNTSSVTNMSFMFYNCSSLTDIVGVENFNIEGLDNTFSLFGFATGVTLPTSRYDALLINWDAQEPFDGMSPHFGNSQYTAGSAAETARANLIFNDGWSITDGGTFIESLYGNHVAILTIPSGNATADLTDFITYIDLSDMPATFWSSVDNGGGSIRIFRETGTNLAECPREIVSCDTSTQTGEVYFKSDLVSLSNNVFRVYADGTSPDYAVADSMGRNAVWNNYALVVHTRNSTKALVDVTGNSPNATLTGTLGTTTVNGFDAISFDGSQRIQFPDVTEHDVFGDNATIQLNLRSESSNNFQIVVSKRQTWAEDGNLVPWEFSIETNGVDISTRFGGRNSFSQRFLSGISLNVDTFITASGGPGLINFYINENSPVSITEGTFSSIGNSESGATIGSLPGGGEEFRGSIAEVRVSGEALTEDWIYTEYSNQSSPSTFYTISANPS